MSFDRDLLNAQRRALKIVELAKIEEKKARLARIRAEEGLAFILAEIRKGTTGREILDAIHAKELEREAANVQAEDEATDAQAAQADIQSEVSLGN